jgi:hypothetical protein
MDPAEPGTPHLIPAPPTPPPEPENLPDETHPKRHWLGAVIGGFLFASAVAAGVWYLLPPTKEEAYAKLLIREKSGDIFQHPEYQTNFQSYLREQIAHLKSRYVINAALNQPKVANLSVVGENSPYVVDWFAKRLKVDTPEDPQIVRVSLVLDNPEEARLIIEAMTEAYFKEVVSKERQQRVDFLEKVKVASARRDGNLRGLNEQIKQLAGANIGAASPKTAAILIELYKNDLRFVYADLQNVNHELRPLLFEESLQAERDKARIGAALFASYSIFAQGGAGPIAVLIPLKPVMVREDAGAEVDSNLSDLRSKIEKFEATLAETRKQLAQSDDPALRRLKEKLDDIRNQLRPIAEMSIHETMRAEPALRRRRIAVLRKQKEDLERDVQDRTEKLVNLTKDGLNLDEKRGEIDREAKLANYLADLREKLTMDLEAPPRVTLLEPATIERVDDFPRRLRLSAIAGVATFALILLGLAFERFWYGRSALEEQ